MKRGEIWWVNFEPSRGSEIKKTRPAVIVSDNVINRIRRTIVVIPLSSSPDPKPPIVIPLTSAGKDSVAVCDQIRTVDKSRFGKLIGSITEAETRQLDKSIRLVLNV